MKTSPAKKMSLLVLTAALAVFSGNRLVNNQALLSDDNDVLRQIRSQLERYTRQRPAERVYLQTDKPFYAPGEDIWFSAYLRESGTLKPSAVSGILYAELIDPKGSVIKKHTLVCRNGKAAGDFNIDAEMPGGLYKIRAFTSWMKNEGEDHVFEKELQVQQVILPKLKMQLNFEKKAFGPGDEVIARINLNTNENKALAAHDIRFTNSLSGKITEQGKLKTDEEGVAYIRFKLPAHLKNADGLLNVLIDYNGSTESISRSVPILLNNLKLDFFPEGGDLVDGLESRVAFKALNSFGKPADVEGVLLSASGSTLAQFASLHQGMGSFNLTPSSGQQYRVKITKPAVDSVYALPETLPAGYVIRTEKKGEQLEVMINSSHEEELVLTAQIAGRLVYSKVLHALKGSNKLTVPLGNFPAGVMQMTLFDAHSVARAERLVFVGENKTLQIAVKTEKEKYLPREKVRMTVQVKDHKGMPVPANLSMAVVNDQLLSFADDKQGNLISQLLLQQELKEKVEELGFYFDPKEKKAAAALDHLLLTSGWRRFTWQQVLTQTTPEIRFPAETTTLTGEIRDGETGRSIAGANIRSSEGFYYTADSSGTFTISNADLSKPYSLTVKAPGYPEYHQGVTQYGIVAINLYKTSYRKRFQQMEMARAAVIPEHEAVMAQPINLEQDMALEKMPAKPMRDAEKNKGDKKAGEIQIAAAEGALVVEDIRFREVKAADAKIIPDASPVYYRAREFKTPVYSKGEVPETRTDFRSTLYWNPSLVVGNSGKTTVEFYAGDDISSFRAVVEGVGVNGQAGRCESLIYTQSPFGMQIKVPVEVLRQDKVIFPLTLTNNTEKPIGGLLTIRAGKGLMAVKLPDSVQTIMPGASRALQLEYLVKGEAGPQPLRVSFNACGLSDAFEQAIQVKDKGFPAGLSFSSQEAEKEYSFVISEPVEGSLRASFTAFPNVISDLMTGVDGILQEPYGCFEQTSCTAYPNAMVLDYLRNTGNTDTKLLARANDLLDRGYKRLTTFETGTKGYEWFGASPAHEGLTAYGIMEFVDMKRAGQAIDEKMLDRTARWLLAHRDGKGGFEREKRALHDFGRISDEIMNAYIVYALAEAGFSEIQKEFEASCGLALQNKDPYMLAMMANAGFKLNRKEEAGRCLSALLKTQETDGSFKGATHSITYSQGSSLLIETTALSLMAMLNAPSKDVEAMRKAVKFLIESRSGSGVFGSTQGTILALKALTAYAIFSKKTDESGEIEIYVDGKKVAEKQYKAGARGNVEITGLEKFIKGGGNHTVRVKFVKVKNPLPHTLSVKWHSALPQSQEACAIDLKTKLAAGSARVGETIRLEISMNNKRNVEQPTTMLIVGLPAGLSPQPWQLKELQEKHVFDYYEIRGNNLAFYYRGLGAADHRTIHLDLKAELAGEFEAPASCAYLYYTNEYKTWAAGEKVLIRK